MKIRIDMPDGGRLDIQVHASGSATIHVDQAHAGQCRWEKDGNSIRLFDIPRTALDEQLRDDESGLRFEFEDRKR